MEDLVDTISPERVKLLLDSGEKLLFIDLRPARDFQQKRLPGARSIPTTEVEKRFREVPKTGRVVLYCACEKYVIADIAIFLENQGYRNIAVMVEGYPGWVKLGYPVEASRP
jgi:rhodanese-related sulfurtransferase